MSINTNSLFKKGKNQTPRNAAVKLSESQLFSMQNNHQPKKIDYSKIAEKASYGSSNYLSENVVQTANEVEKKNYYSYNDETKTVLNKFDSPKVGGKRNKRKISSSSNLPTANNSFHTNISSPEHDKNANMEEYQGLAANYGSHGSAHSHRGKTGMIRKSSDNDYDSVDGELNSVGSPNTSLNVGVNSHNPKTKKSEDFKVKFKTEKCKFWEIDKNCKFGDNCAFAHGNSDLRKKSTVTSAYRTKKCKQFFDNGFCPYGNRCQFAHALKSNMNIQAHFSYKKFMNLLLNQEDLDLLTTANKRLSIFLKISNCKDSNLYSSYVDDIKKLYKENYDTNELTNRSRIFSY